MSHNLDLSDKNILIVEDDNMSYLFLNQIFKITKGQVTRAKNGKDAIQICREKDNIDLVLMDIQLPDMNGIATTNEIRKFNKAVPIIAQTASRSHEEKESALNSGCTDIIIKPFKMEDLLEKIALYIP
jgi:CheY-like chemotaxis protein